MNGLKPLNFFSVLAFAGLVAIVTPGQTAWTEYLVTAGNHDFKPNDFPSPHFGADTYTADFYFAASCWWSAGDEDYHGGRDIEDWNKLGGMTNFFNANSTHSVLFGWRPAKRPATIEVTAYINPKSGRFVTGPVVQVPADVPMSGRIYWAADTVYYEYGAISFQHPLEKPWAIRKVGPWFGGNQTAHRAMRLFMESGLE